MVVSPKVSPLRPPTKFRPTTLALSAKVSSIFTMIASLIYPARPPTIGTPPAITWFIPMFTLLISGSEPALDSIEAKRP